MEKSQGHKFNSSSCKRSQQMKTVFSNVFKLMQIIATQMIAHHSVNLNLIQNPTEQWPFNNWIVSGKHFKAIS